MTNNKYPKPKYLELKPSDKIGLFTDSHLATSSQYEKLLSTFISQKINQVIFLGDTDCDINQEQGLNAHINFIMELNTNNIDFHAIRGNHCQGWIDYLKKHNHGWIGKWVTHNPLIRKNSDLFLNYLEALPAQIHTNLSITFSHTLLTGPQFSYHKGRNGKPVNLNDPRIITPELWYYSFATGKPETNNGSHPFESYCPQTIEANFQKMKRSNTNILIKGHQHQPQTWSKNPRDIYNGRINRHETSYMQKNTTPKIFQIGAFQNGHYSTLTIMPNSIIHITHNNLNFPENQPDVSWHYKPTK